MGVRELSTAISDHRAVGNLVRTLPDGTVDPIVRVEEATIPPIKRGPISRLMDLLTGKKPEDPGKAFVAIGADAEAAGTRNPIVKVSLDHIHGHEAQLALDAESPLINEDPAMVKGILTLAMEEVGVTVALLPTTDTNMSGEVLEQAGFVPLHEGQDLELRLAA